MSSNIKKFLLIANNMVATTNQKRQVIKDEGKTNEWEQKQYETLLNNTLEQSEKISQDMQEVASGELIEAKNKAKETRVKPNNNIKQADSAAKLYHQNNAIMAMDRFSETEAIEAYTQIIDNLTEQERKENLHVYEDVLLNKMKDKANRLIAEQEIFKHKSPDEKVAIVAAQRAEKQLESVKMISEHFKYDIEKIASGQLESPGYDYVSLFDEPTQKERQMQQQEPAQGGGTPYDAGMKDN